MRVIIVSAPCLFAGLPSAYAGSGSAQGLGVIGFAAGQASGNRESMFKQFTDADGSVDSSGTIFNNSGFEVVGAVAFAGFEGSYAKN